MCDHWRCVQTEVRDRLQRLRQQSAAESQVSEADSYPLLWLPVKLREDFDRWLAGLEREVDRPLLVSLLWLHPPDSRAALNGSAMVVVNPPYLLEEGLREWLPELRDILGEPQAGYEILVTTERR